MEAFQEKLEGETSISENESEDEASSGGDAESSNINASKSRNTVQRSSMKGKK